MPQNKRSTHTSAHCHTIRAESQLGTPPRFPAAAAMCKRSSQDGVLAQHIADTSDLDEESESRISSMAFLGLPI